MIHIAKMGTNYPDYHGSGYYNFLMEDSADALEDKIEEYSHDFHLVAQKETKFQSVENLVKKYPSKDKLNAALFGVA